MNNEIIDLFFSNTPLYDKQRDYVGLVFRAFSSVFFRHGLGSIEKREGFNFLKKRSFQNKANYGVFEFFNETAAYSPESIIWPKNIEHGKLYGLRIINERRDWETGIVDDYDLEFFKLEEHS